MIRVEISRDLIDIDDVKEYLHDPSCGGMVYFVGTVRNHNKGEPVVKLEFETYAPMAIREMKKICDHCIDTIGVKKIALIHREGVVNIGETAVVIGVVSIHRDKAFEACQYAINTLKKTVPIWKKEYLSNGSYWVGNRP